MKVGTSYVIGTHVRCCVFKTMEGCQSDTGELVGNLKPAPESFLVVEAGATEVPIAEGKTLNNYYKVLSPGVLGWIGIDTDKDDILDTSGCVLKVENPDELLIRKAILSS